MPNRRGRIGSWLAAPLTALVALAVQAAAPVIDVWSGNNQTFGTLGQPQVWVNLLGNAMDHAELTGFDAASTNGGTVVNNGDGTFTYTPPGGFTGTDSFGYTLTDDAGATDSATVNIIVAPVVPGLPLARNDQYSTLEARAVTTGNVLDNDSIVDNAVISGIDTTGTSGTVIDKGDGSFVYYPPAAPFTGDDSFSYTLTDDQLDSDTATVTVTVLPATAVLPTAVDDSYSTATDAPLTTGNVLANDTLGDQDSIASLSYSLNGGASVTLSVGPRPSARPQRLVGQGDFNADIATSLLAEGVNTVTVTAQDRDGNTTVQAVTLDYTSAPVWPLPYTIDWASVARVEDVAQIVDGRWVLEADSVRTAQVGYDRILAIGDLSWDNYEIQVPVTVHGLDPVCINDVGDCRGSPAVHLVARWPGHYDFGFQQPEIGWEPIGAAGSYKWERTGLSPACSTSLCDGRLALTGGSFQTDLGEDTARDLPFGVPHWFKLRAETVAGQGHLYRVKMWPLGQPEPGQWDLSGLEPFTSVSLANGSALLIGHNVDVSFGDVTVNPVAPDMGPVANDDAFAVNQDSTNNPLGVLANDSDPDGDPLSIVAVGLPDNGGSATLNDNGTPADPGDDYIDYTPMAGFTGTETFSYDLSDGFVTAQATVTNVVQTAGADVTPPVISAVQVSSLTETSAIISWLTDEAADSSVASGTSAGYENGAVNNAVLVTVHSIALTGLNPGTEYHYQVSSSDSSTNAASSGDLTFTTLASNPSGLTSDEFNSGSLNEGLWTVTDGVGDTTVSMTGNQLSIAVPGGVEHSIWNNGNLSTRVMQAAGDADFEVEAKFDVQLSGVYQSQGILVEQDANNYIRFDFYQDSSGANMRIFAGTTANGNPTQQIKTVIPNGPPNYIRVKRVGDLWTESYSYDGINWTNAGSFTHLLNVSSVGVFAANFNTSSTPYTVLVDRFTVVGGSGVPDAVDDPSAGSAPENTPLTTIDVLANDTLVDNAVISAFDNPSANGGTVVDNGDGTFGYTPALDFNGSDSFTYTLTDEQGDFDTATVTVTVTSVAAPDGDIVTDGQLNAADLLMMYRMVLNQVPPDLTHADIYPPGTGDGVVDLSDLILLQQWILQGAAP